MSTMVQPVAAAVEEWAVVVGRAVLTKNQQPGKVAPIVTRISTK